MSEKEKVATQKERKFDRYLFETEFSSTSSLKNNEPKPLTPEDLAQAEADGYQKGLEEGKKQAEEDFATTLNIHTQKIITALEDETLRRQETIKLATERAIHSLETLASILLEDARKNYPEDLAKTALTTITQAPQNVPLTLLTAPETKTYFKEALPKVEEDNQLIIKEDKTLKPGDYILSWPQGGIDLNREVILQKISHLFSQSIAHPQEGDFLTDETPQNTTQGESKPAEETKTIETSAPDTQASQEEKETSPAENPEPAKE